DKKGCGGAVWTNLDVTTVIKRNDHIESCPVDEHLAYKMEKKAVLKKRSAEETKPIPAIYDEEASAASAQPSTSGHFLLFKWVKSTMYSHRAKRYPKLLKHRRDLQIPVPFRRTKAGDESLLWQSASRHILVFGTGSNIKLLAPKRTWGMDGTFKVVPQWYQQHFKMNRLAGKRHLGFYELLQLLIDEQGSTETLNQQVTSGRVTANDLHIKNKKYEQLQQRITALTAEYDGGTRTMQQLLRVVA
ncbi:hypothetical protein T12_2728, partial [Trichinella patagoniensis]